MITFIAVKRLLYRRDPRDHWTVMEILSAYVRKNSIKEIDAEAVHSEVVVAEFELDKDVQAAITVLGRRDSKCDPAIGRVDLSDADLRGGRLSGANLGRAILRRANLSQANLRRADLAEADLRGVILDGAMLDAANLRDANCGPCDLSGEEFGIVDRIAYGATSLRGASLVGANLRNADLYEADLRGACLHDADLLCADLRGADLSGVTGLRPEQVRKAQINSETELPFDRSLL